jgi:hypothetical protein
LPGNRASQIGERVNLIIQHDYFPAFIFTGGLGTLFLLSSIKASIKIHRIYQSIFLISISLIIIAHKLPLKSLSKSNMALLFIGATLYGFNFSVDGIEGQTILFTFPAAGFGFILALSLYLRRKREGSQNPFLLFYLIAYSLSLLLFAYWGVSHSGFPQFSELGWI